MVSEKKIQPVFLVKLRQKPEGVAVHGDNVRKVSVFPQLSPSAKLNIVNFSSGKIQSAPSE
jgi:hypothetical protein